MVDFSALKKHVNSSLVDDAEILRLGRARREPGPADVRVGNAFGRVVSWLLPDAVTGTRHAGAPDGVRVFEDPFEMMAHQDVKMRVLDALIGQFDDHVLNKTSQLIDWTSSKPLTAREVSILIKTAEHLQDSAPAAASASNAHLGHYSDGNRLGELRRLGAGMVNAVSSATFMQDSQAREMVFKPTQDRAPENFPFYGIQTRESLGARTGACDIVANGNVAGRNIASHELAHALGMPEMITQTLQTRQGGVEGIAMAKARGNCVFSADGRFSFGTSFGPQEIARRLPQWNARLADHNLVITGHKGSQVHLETLDAGSRTAKFIEQLRVEIQHLKGITLDDAGNLKRTGKVSDAVFEDISDSLQRLMYRARCVSMLPVDPQGRIHDGRLNCDLNRLQWLDFICAQGDRNPNNLFIQYDPAGQVMGITGIDNDVSFGEFVDHDGIHLDGGPQVQRGVAYQGMPRNVIDAGTAAKIKDLYADKDKFAAVLQANQLTASEISAATRRLATAYERILEWEAGKEPDAHILPREAALWEKQGHEGYSKYFADLHAILPKSLQVSSTQLGSLLR